MKETKQNTQPTFIKKISESENLFLRLCNKVYNSSWGIVALLATISAWTAGILYV